jgi:hypothetical protein
MDKVFDVLITALGNIINAFIGSILTPLLETIASLFCLGG